MRLTFLNIYLLNQNQTQNLNHEHNSIDNKIDITPLTDGTLFTRRQLQTDLSQPTFSRHLCYKINLILIHKELKTKDTVPYNELSKTGVQGGPVAILRFTTPRVASIFPKPTLATCKSTRPENSELFRNYSPVATRRLKFWV